MSAALKPFALAMAIALAACSEAEQAPVNNSTAADIEVLPADESAATTSEELQNGVNEPDVGNLGNQH